MSRKKPWREPANLISAGAAILALASLAVSIRGCQAADRSLALSTAEYRAQRLLILGGTPSSTGDSFSVKALDPSVTLVEARVVFPTTVEKQEWPVLPPDHQLYVLMLRSGLQAAIQKLVGRRQGHALVSLDANVPLVISSLYTAKGETFEDRSLYRIMYSFVMDDDTEKPPTVEFKGLTFVNRLGPNDDPRAIVDHVWGQVVFNTK